MKKINFTKKEAPTFLLLFLSEVSLLAVEKDLTERSKFTKKWSDFMPKIRDITGKTHSLVSFLEYCLDRSAIKHNELMELKFLILTVIEIVLNIEDKDIKKGIAELRKTLNIIKFRQTGNTNANRTRKSKNN